MLIKNKGKIVFIRDMKARGGWKNGYVPPYILNLDTRWKWGFNLNLQTDLFPEKDPSVPSE